MQSVASEQVGQTFVESEPMGSYGLNRPMSSNPKKKGMMKEATFGERRVVLPPFTLLTVDPSEAARKDGSASPIDLVHSPFSAEDFSLSRLLFRYRC